MLFWDGKALNRLEQRVQGLSHCKPPHSARPSSWTIYVVLPHTFSLKPGQPPLFTLCGVHDCEWWIEGSAGRNVLLSNVVVECFYNQWVFWLHRFSPGCMRGTTFCSYLSVSLSFFHIFSIFLLFSVSAWWMVILFICSLVSAECVRQVIHNKITPTPRPAEFNTSLKSSYCPFTPGIKICLGRYDHKWSALSTDVSRVLVLFSNKNIKKNIHKTRSIYLRSKSM